MNVPLLNDTAQERNSNVEYRSSLSVDSFSISANSTVKQRKLAAVKKSLSGFANVKILDDFAKSETPEIDGSTSIRYSFVVHYDRWKCLTANFTCIFALG